MLLAAALLSCQLASAGEPPRIDLARAVQRTLAHNPTLNSLGYQVRAQEGAVIQAGLGPNPELGLLVENVLGSGELNGFSSAETTLSLGWVLERGKREARIERARAGISLVESEARIHRRETATETARRFLDSLAFQAREALAKEAVSIAADSVSRVTARVKAGRAPGADLARARAALARAKLTLEDFEHELKTSNHRLASQWGDHEPDFVAVAGNLLELPRVASYAELSGTLQTNPDVQQYATVARLRDAELRLAKAQARPNWRVNMGIRHLQQSGDQALVAGITIPLPTRNQNQGRIAAANANLQRVDEDRKAVEIEIGTRLFALHQALQHALHTSNTLTESVIPLTESALIDTRRAYNAGRYGYFQLQQVQNELLQARLDRVEAAISAHRHAVEIERLTGTVLTKGALR